MGYAIVSVYFKRGVLRLAKIFIKHDIGIIATGNTEKYLKNHGIPCKSVEEITGFSEILSGRVKTLHPCIFAGILANRENPEHLKEIKKFNFPLIDFVVVNLYPFEKKPCIENIDIGGVSLLRAAAKNWKWVTAVSSIDDYSLVVEELNKNGNIGKETRMKLAKKTFSLTSRIDSKIRGWIGREKFIPAWEKVQQLRYGENPHQEGILYRDIDYNGLTILNAKKWQGKKLSFNNIYDLDTALRIMASFEEPLCCILKHTSPCGVAREKSLFDAYTKARSADPISSFGSIVGFNREVDEKLAREITKTFVEAVLAPKYTTRARETFRRKKNLRILELPLRGGLSLYDLRCINGGILWQDNDIFPDDESKFSVVTKRIPGSEEMEALKFANRIVRFLKSNAICIGTSDMTVGIGQGQPNRVDSLKIALSNKKKFGFNKGVFGIASDGFLPFRDSIDVAATSKIRAIIQPGGSIRDKEVIDACNEQGIAMVFTGKRHFRH